MSHTQSLPHMTIRRLPLVIAGFVASVVLAGSGYAQQVVYYSPVVAQPAPYVSQYTPSGTYSAVTAYSAPVAAVPASSVAVTSYYAPATTAYYAPAATTSYYAPTTSYYAPTTAYYANSGLLRTNRVRYSILLPQGPLRPLSSCTRGGLSGLLSGLLIDNFTFGESNFLNSLRRDS